MVPKQVPLVVSPAHPLPAMFLMLLWEKSLSAEVEADVKASSDYPASDSA